VQYPGLQGGGALGDASTPDTPAGFIASSAHGGTYSHVAVAGGAWGGERGAAAATAAAAAGRRRATPTEGAVNPPGSALTTPLDGVRNRRQAAATKAGAQARSPAGHRGPVEARMSLRAVSGSNLGRWGGAGGQGPSGPCDPGCGTVLLCHLTSFAFSVFATFPTLTRSQILEDTNADCLL